MQYGLIVILIILILLDLYLTYCNPEQNILSFVDGGKYSVKKRFSDYNAASDILARLNKANETIIKHMENKYPNSDDVKFLSGNYDGGAISEHTPISTVNTSYVLNKGDLIKICLRDPTTNKLHDYQTILFVNLHELSHLLDTSFGHNRSFWDCFKRILEEATELGIYTPVDYSKNPVKYCGLEITTSPLFHKILGDDEK